MRYEDNLPPFAKLPNVEEVTAEDAIEAWRKGETDGILYDYVSVDVSWNEEAQVEDGIPLSRLCTFEIVDRSREFFFYRVYKTYTTEETLKRLQEFLRDNAPNIAQRRVRVPSGLSFTAHTVTVDHINDPKGDEGMTYNELQYALRYINRWLDEYDA